jgi:hypothetical protein
MNKFTDQISYEAELKTTSGETIIVTAGPMSYDLIKRVDEETDKLNKSIKNSPGKETLLTAESNYITFSMTFKVSLEDAHKFSPTLIMAVIRDYKDFLIKNAGAQSVLKK